MKAFKAFIKPFETPQRSVKIKFNLIFSLCPGLGREGLTGCVALPIFIFLNMIYFKIDETGIFFLPNHVG